MLKKSLLLLFSFLLVTGLQAKLVPPKSNTIVTDYAGVLNESEKARLERKLVQYDDSSSTQIAVVLDKSLQGEPIFEYSYQLAEAWGIGQKGKDNGVLIYAAMEDRKVFIQTGYGAEGFLPDALAKRIVDNVILPAFRKRQYYEGLDRATTIVMDLSRGEYTADEAARRDSGGLPPGAVVFLLIILIALVSYFTNRGDDDEGGYYRGGRYDYDDYGRGRRRGRGGGWIFIPGGGGWSGGGSGGGFGGFGGGGFGGGGAGGSW